MEQAELELLVGELESRMERLRSLYDMYFMGIEKLEPLVPRKDVERRMQALRKEQIRNTGLRFKFQTVIQRFNTYQTYWLRIARQIENGTYRRDVMRATARFGVDPTKERASSTSAAPAESDRSVPSAPRVVIPDEPIEELYAEDALSEDVDLEDDPFGHIARPAPPARVPPERFASAGRFELDDLADPFEEADPFPRPAGSPSAPKLRIAPRPGASKAPEEHRDTERRMPVAPVSRSMDPADQGPGTVRGTGTGMGTGKSNEQRVIIARRASIPDELERGPTTRSFGPASSPSMSPSASSGSPSASAPSPGSPSSPSSPSLRSGPTLQKPGTLPSAITPSGRIVPGGNGPAAPAPAPSAPAAAASAPVAAPPGLRRPATLPSAGIPVVRLPAAPAPAPAPAPAATAPPPPAPKVAARPAPPPPPAPVRSAPAAPPASVPQRAAPAPAPPPRIGDLSGDRFGEIFSSYVETRKKHNEPTHAITRDALAKQLAESTARLKQKHGEKAIDFEVVVKDGKTILRPVVK